MPKRTKGFQIGNIPWNKGLSGVYKHKPFSKETRKKMSEIRLKRKKELGYINSPETRAKISKTQRGQRHSPATEFKKGHIPWSKGRHIRLNPKGEFKKGGHPGAEFGKGEKHPYWQGGISFEPYSPEFNKELKAKIRKKFNYKCFECNLSEKKLGYKLSIHHVDYNKKNNREDNLVPLCMSCHSQTNFGREDWTNYFKQKQLW